MILPYKTGPAARLIPLPVRAGSPPNKPSQTKAGFHNGQAESILTNLQMGAKYVSGVGTRRFFGWRQVDDPYSLEERGWVEDVGSTGSYYPCLDGWSTCAWAAGTSRYAAGPVDCTKNTATVVPPIIATAGMASFWTASLCTMTSSPMGDGIVSDRGSDDFTIRSKRGRRKGPVPVDR